MVGFKGMLRDQMPLMVNLALKRCKAKEKWINHTYNNFIKIFVDLDLRREATLIVLGKKKKTVFNFDKTIMWENLSEEDNYYWSCISDWVKWFMKYYAYINNDYDIYASKGILSEIEIKNQLMKSYSLDCETADYLIKCFKTYKQ